ncbi:uncharacterized protein LOC116654245 [Coturnix japonica]|uniref:uncharacterized protein LOC116654245 n=1 Tax=Coturnix japonica TaxID=93934 RepID=UPI0013A5F0B1|nr:uncharacterized protein LOC116654245 [Coturnix japonica]
MQGRRDGGVALYVRECFHATEIVTGDNKVESLWVKIRGRADKADILVGVCYRPPNQDEETDEVFYKQLAQAARSPALVLMGDFNFPDICWEYSTAQKKQSRRFLECIEDSFLMQQVREPTRGAAPLDLLFASREGLVGDVKVGGCLGQSDHEMVDFSILGGAWRGNSKTATLDFWRVDFELFKRLVGGVPWHSVLASKGVQDGWLLFKKEVLREREQVVPLSCKMSQEEEDWRR